MPKIYNFIDHFKIDHNFLYTEVAVKCIHFKTENT